MEEMGGTGDGGVGADCFLLLAGTSGAGGRRHRPRGQARDGDQRGGHLSYDDRRSKSKPQTRTIPRYVSIQLLTAVERLSVLHK